MDSLESQIVEHAMEFFPRFAVMQGLHEYDGRIPSVDPSSTERWATEAERLLRALSELPESELSEERSVDRLLLQLLLEGPLFDLRESRDYEANPMVYLFSISLEPYLVRDYAPLPTRVEAMVSILEGIPPFLHTALKRLRPALPEPFVRIAIGMGAGLIQHFLDAEEIARSADPALGARFRSARTAAEAAVREFVDRLRGEFLPRAVPEFAIGAGRYQKLLWVREAIRTPYPELLRTAEADLRHNQSRLSAIAMSLRPPADAKTLFDVQALRHPAADQLVPVVREMIGVAKEFVEQTSLVTVPPASICRVEESPPYDPMSIPRVNTPGPFEKVGLEGVCYVPTGNPSWSSEQREGWLRTFNLGLLRTIAVHEAYPGHYLHFLHFRRAPLSMVRKAFWSTTFVEGWAHYCEELLVEQGFGGRTPDAEVAYRQSALIFDCSVIASIKMHTAGMTVAEAQRLFESEAYLGSGLAEQFATRPTFNPGCYAYMVGRLAIRDLRTRHLSALFGGSLRAFHDRLLSFGSPPVGLLERLLQPRPAEPRVSRRSPSV